LLLRLSLKTKTYHRTFHHRLADKHFNLRSKGAKSLYQHICDTRDTLAFCRRWLDDEGQVGSIIGVALQ
jgi:hypothetical protein